MAGYGRLEFRSGHVCPTGFTVALDLNWLRIVRRDANRIAIRAASPVMHGRS